ncbi:MAG TPA: lysyl oxidase family protein, partial [Actinomycetota bacterium]|nr:lysyl oxidase family protein [Actinomycetota bacterium]
EARNVIEGRFRMRAKLEMPVPPISPGRPRALLPNMRLLPPFKFTFLSPSFTRSSSGCTEDEIAEHRPQRCLRFSLGPANTGDGPLELFYEQLEGVGQRGTIYQTIHYSDGSTKRREAGEFEYHAAHGHFHHAGFGSLVLYRVMDPKSGEMVRAGEGPKQGFCMAPYLIVDWRSFNNDRAYSAEADCLETTPATGAHMGLDKGWADIYDWYLSGNYVDFGVNTDGLYVVRSMTDAARDIQETDETDNWSYAYIEVSGDRIDVLERGYGRSPWDPNKIVEPNWLMLTVP